MTDTERPWIYFMRETFPLAHSPNGGIAQPPKTNEFKPPTADAVAVSVQWDDTGCHVTWRCGAYWVTE